MKVLVLGGSGHIGAAFVRHAGSGEDVEVWRASRRAVAAGERAVQLDTLDGAALARALAGFDGVVNCVAGSAQTISAGAGRLAQAALQAGCGRIVHLSTVSVYGPVEGRIREDAALDPGLGWYAQAKCEAEARMGDFARQGGQVVVLRPGCVAGPGSQPWVGRIGRWLRAGRLGDLGAAGDGWTNLVHVLDVCRAIEAGLRLPLQGGALQVFNLAAPDSPRWSSYFVDLGVAIGASPIQRLSPRRLRLDAKLLGPPLKVAEKLMSRLGLPAQALPEAISPALVRLWQQQIQLDAGAASDRLGLSWTPYPELLQDSADWFNSRAG
ncbi:NAD-dependent epimerase/dehydratase family protein [Xylophilus rhododendri]|uniref:NAD-dependent epimerase/dehydratase family protein n=1 Tax=Xylophilus rhododendri TaxID=2697032 RepID=A0A857J8D3_9BURK|nr:NAD(P)-dependent oxidoreductase [Xylophilus rhododendri]QHI99977.1 NAD-dependent epimerase/dehydratase family protein [Xylophilus rhododendri]